MIIDWHNHWLSPRSIDLLLARTEAPYLRRSEDGTLTYTGAGKALARPSLALDRGFHDIPTRLAHLDEAGVDRQVISWPTTFGLDGVLEADFTVPFFKAWNEDLAVLVRKHPDRFTGLAALPTADIAWSAAELQRAHDVYGFIGGVLPVGAFLTLEGAETLRPIFEVAERNHSHIYLHTGAAHPSIPGQWSSTLRQDAAWARWLLEVNSHFAASIITLTLGGFLDRYPNVTVQIAMLGGTLSFLEEAITTRSRPEADPDVPASLKRVFIDTGVMGQGPNALASAYRVFGPDRILFGSDYPLVPSQRTLEVVEQSGLSHKQKSLLLAGNGEHLLKQLVRS
ncbi:amidohydrolase family protein [Granulicella sibirica]|uniref:2-amino-3-carboxymuconate-6-semialdehyde decarboxylase n=1 Tax=Granulicella sibirica TaxID=2479048 RepID=A0A4V1L646_9BACT|nr:amidohydrolase family protein [Granulicella sibirica]RXH57994.1 2-amino-3-carboxymuconate-6-semialdehyde decarboxylase [Granulicella sibirica]